MSITPREITRREIIKYSALLAGGALLPNGNNSPVPGRPKRSFEAEESVVNPETITIPNGAEWERVDGTLIYLTKNPLSGNPTLYTVSELGAQPVEFYKFETTTERPGFSIVKLSNGRYGVTVIDRFSVAQETSDQIRYFEVESLHRSAQTAVREKVTSVDREFLYPKVVVGEDSKPIIFFVGKTVDGSIADLYYAKKRTILNADGVQVDPEDSEAIESGADRILKAEVTAQLQSIKTSLVAIEAKITSLDHKAPSPVDVATQTYFQDIWNGLLAKYQVDQTENDANASAVAEQIETLTAKIIEAGDASYSVENGPESFGIWCNVPLSAAGRNVTNPNVNGRPDGNIALGMIDRIGPNNKPGPLFSELILVDGESVRFMLDGVIPIADNNFDFTDPNTAYFAIDSAPAIDGVVNLVSMEVAGASRAHIHYNGVEKRLNFDSNILNVAVTANDNPGWAMGVVVLDNGEVWQVDIQKAGEKMSVTKSQLKGVTADKAQIEFVANNNYRVAVSMAQEIKYLDITQLEAVQEKLKNPIWMPLVARIKEKLRTMFYGSKAVA